MSDEQYGTLGLLAIEVVQALYQIFAAELETSLRGIGMPSRLVVVSQDPCIRDDSGEHVDVLQPVYMRSLPSLVLPDPRPIHI